MEKTLIEVKYAITCNRNFDIIKNAAIAFENGKITYVGQIKNIPYSRSYFDNIILEEYGIAIPGLINCHTHAAMNLFRGACDDLPLKLWLEKKIWPLESKLTSEDLFYGNLSSFLEMLSSGTTTFVDFYYFNELIDALKVIPLRAVATIAFLDQVPDGEIYWRRFKELQKYFDMANSIGDELVKIALGPHAIYTCSKELLEKIMDVSEKHNLLVHMHVSETLDEVHFTKEKFGLTPIEYLDKIGILNEKMIAAHCVHLKDKDINILQKKKVNCVHNPSSNLKLADGVMPLSELLKAGINVCLGTDGAASSNSLNLFNEMRTAVLLQRGVNLDPKFPNAKDAFLMATANGARALGLDNHIGSIEENKKADIVIIDGKSPRLWPEYDIISNIVYSCTPADILFTIVNGKILYEKGKFPNIDIENIMGEFNKKALKLLNTIN
ncbi:MAG: amidohydrolase [Nitrososphaeria archaeon]|nr:amidohydrolase [Nitrososphaeria archaeon]